MDMRTNYCPRCGLMYRLWVHKAERNICDECEPEKFKELHDQNITNYKRRKVGQQHITEHTFFPDHPKDTTRKDRFIRDIK